jgi:hypothetical protein
MEPAGEDQRRGLLRDACAHACLGIRGQTRDHLLDGADPARVDEQAHAVLGPPAGIRAVHVLLGRQELGAGVVAADVQVDVAAGLHAGALDRSRVEVLAEVLDDRVAVGDELGDELVADVLRQAGSDAARVAATDLPDADLPPPHPLDDLPQRCLVARERAADERVVGMRERQVLARGRPQRPDAADRRVQREGHPAARGRARGGVLRDPLEARRDALAPRLVARHRVDERRRAAGHAAFGDRQQPAARRAAEQRPGRRLR